MTVLPVPGGPWMRPRGLWNTVRMVCICELFSFGKLGTDNLVSGRVPIRGGWKGQGVK